MPAVVQVQEPAQALAIVQAPNFTPQLFGVVETQPPLALEQPGQSAPVTTGVVQLVNYKGELVSFTVEVAKNSLLVTGEKYANGWKATVDGKPAEIQRVNYVLRGVYLSPGRHEVQFIFDPLSFKIGKWLTLGSFAVFAVVLVWEWRRRTISPAPLNVASPLQRHS